MRISNINEITEEQKKLENWVKRTNKIGRRSIIIFFAIMIVITVLSIFFPSDTNVNTNVNITTNETNEYVVGALLLGSMASLILFIVKFQNYRIKKRKFNTEEMTYYMKIFNQLLTTFNTNRIVNLKAGNRDQLKNPNYNTNLESIANQLPEILNNSLEKLPKEFATLSKLATPKTTKIIKSSFKANNSITPLIILFTILGGFALVFYYLVSVGEMQLTTAIYTIVGIIGLCLLVVIFALIENKESKYIDSIVLKDDVIEITLLNKQLQTDITLGKVTYNLNDIDIKYKITTRQGTNSNRHGSFYYLHNIYIKVSNSKIKYRLLPSYSFNNQAMTDESYLFFNEDLKSFVAFVNLVKQKEIFNLSPEQLEKLIKDSSAY